jgi:hypothetical protein
VTKLRRLTQTPYSSLMSAPATPFYEMLMRKILCRAFDSLAPAPSASGLPVYVARRPPAPFCETPIQKDAV